MRTFVLFLVLSFSSAYSQWEQCGADIFNNAISIYSKNDSLYVGTYFEGVFISTNKGQSFTNIGLNLGDVTCLLKVNDTLFAGIMMGQGSTVGIQKTFDNGKNWMKLNITNNTDAPDIYRLFKYNEMIFSATSGGIYYSVDFGKTWTLTNMKMQGITAIAADSSNLFYGSQYSKGAFASTDTGKTWRSIGLENETLITLLIDGSDIYAGTMNGSVFYSSNKGSDWTIKNKNFVTTRVYELIKNGDYLIAGTNDGVFISSDKGDNWIQKNSGLNNLYISRFAIVKDYVFAVSYQSVFRAKLFELTKVIDVIETKLDFSEGEFIDVSLYDILGRCLSVKTLIYKTGLSFEDIFPGLLSGCYFYLIKSQNKTLYRKLVIRN